MAETSLLVRILHAAKTEAQWTTSDPVLLNGEIAISSDKNTFKIGTGVDKWSNLQYIQALASDVYAWAKASTKPTYKWSEITGKPSTFTPSSHTHDDRYYTETEMNTKLLAKADADHDHVKADITDLNKQLTDEDLNNIKDFGFYYAGGGNTTAGIPSGVTAYGLFVTHSASGNRKQIMYASSNRTYERQWNGTEWSSWRDITVLTPVPANAKFTDTVYTHPTTSGNKHIPSGGASGQILRWSADGTAVWGADNNTWRGIQNNLTSDSTTDSLSAAQGKVLKESVNTKVSKGGDTMTGTLNSSVTAGTYLAGNQGKAIIASTASAGSYTMLAKMNSTNGVFTQGTYQTKYLLQYTANTTIEDATNSVTKSVTLLDEAGNSTFPGTVTATLFSGSGASLTSLNASNVSSGTLNSSRLPTVPVSKGGTGLTTLTSGQVLVGNGTGNVTTRAIDTTTGGTSGSTSLITSGAVYAGLAKKADTHSHPYLPLPGGTMTGNIAYNLYASTQTPFKVYGGNANGQGISVGGGAATIVGAGESAKACEALLDATTEQLWLTSDSSIIFYTNCNTIDDKVGVTLSAVRAFYPNTTNTGSLGTSGNKWATAYATTFYGGLDGTIKSTTTSPTADTTYYIDMHSGNSTGQKTLYHTGGFRHNFRKGVAEVKDSSGTVTTAAVTGYNKLLLGNATASGTDNNAYGALRLYSTNTGYAELKYNSSTANTTHYLPTTGGTLLNSGTTSYTAGLTSGTTVGTLKINGTNYTLYAPTNTDTKVTQSATTASNYRPLLMGTTSTTDVSALAATITDRVYVNTGIYAQPSTGTIVATTFKGNATTASKWATARTLSLTGAITGSVSLDGSANASITTKRKSCSVGQSSSTNTNPYYKFAACTCTTAYDDRYISMKVSKGYGDSSKAVGILTAHFRVNGSISAVESTQLLWEYAGEGIDVSKFSLCYKVTSGTSVDVQLYVCADVAYAFYHFDVLSEGTRASNGSYWTLYNASSAGQSSALPSGYTAIASTLGKITNATTGNAGTATQVYSTLTNPTSASTYVIPFHSTASSANKSLRNNDGLKYYTLEGTASAVGKAELGLGNETASGTAGNKQGKIYMYGTSSGYTYLVPGNNTTSNITVTLPTKSGTLALASDYLPLSGGTVTGSIKTSKTALGYYLVDSTGYSYPGVYDNGSNLWIGSTANATKHHTGSTYISAGHNGTSGNTTIYVAIPNADNNAGTGYAVLHAGNYTSYTVTKTGSGASGSWGISITGNAATATKLGTATVGGSTTPIYLSTGTATACSGRTVPGIKSASTATTLGWGTNNNYVPDISLLAYWNGCYSGTSSNLQYCDRGRFGTIVTKSTGDYATASHTHSYIPLSGSTGITGVLRSNSEIQTTSANAFRAVSGNYGFFIRNDGSNVYFMLTNSGNQYGNWNDFRPITINNSTGICNINGNASTASKVYGTLTNLTTATTYYIPFHSGASSANKSLLNNNGLQYYTLEGTTSAVGTAQLGLGNSTASGTAGNKQGKIYMYGTSSGYTTIVPSYNSTSNITVTLPSSSGTLALTSHTHSASTTSVAGFMSAADKSKLDGIATGANKYTHPSYTAKSSGFYKVTVDATGHVSAATAVTKADITGLGIPSTNTTYSVFKAATSSAAGGTGLVPAPAAGAQAKFLRADGTWQTPTNTTYSAATTSAAGLMSATDKSFIDLIRGEGLDPTWHYHTCLYSGLYDGGKNPLIVTYYASDTKGLVFRYTDHASTNLGNKLLGSPSYRWSTIYASAALNTGSDRRLKENFHRFNEAYEKAYMEMEPTLYNFRNVSDEDSHDRTHGGYIAQDVEAAMTKYGLSTNDFAFLCKDPVSTFTDDSGKPNNPYDKYGINDYLYSLKHEEMIPLNHHMIKKTINHQTEQDIKIAELETLYKDALERIARLEERLAN